MFKKKIFHVLGISLLVLSLFASCGNSKDTKVETKQNDIPSAEEAINAEDYFKNKGAINPNDSSMDSETFDFAYVPTIYMQSYDSLMMPNGKSVAASGNLLVCVSMIASYCQKQWITPDTLISDYPTIFNENGSVDIDKAMTTFCNSSKRIDFDYQNMIQELNEGAVILLRIPQRSKFGEVSTYLIVTGVTSDGAVEVRDPNQNNIKSFGTPVKYFHSYTYDCGDIIISAGDNSFMYAIY